MGKHYMFKASAPDDSVNYSLLLSMEFLRFPNLNILKLWKVKLNFEIQAIETETIFEILI